jgi:hypothetical protein
MVLTSGLIQSHPENPRGCHGQQQMKVRSELDPDGGRFKNPLPGRARRNRVGGVIGKTRHASGRH